MHSLNYSGVSGLVGAALAALVPITPAAAQSGPAARAPSYTVAINQDSFFGFYPSFSGAIPVSEKTDFTFYGIFWTKPAFGLNPTNTGDDLWTEFGVGVNLNLADGKLKVKPQIGITNGALLSGGDLDENGNVEGANFADGLVPSLTVNYADDAVEAELYAGYYAALRNRSGDAALDFLHTWVNAGYKFSSNVSAGAHYELLSNTRNTYPDGSSARVYQWIGPYVQFSLPQGFYARFTGGADVESGNAGDFYKLSIGMSF